MYANDVSKKVARVFIGQQRAVCVFGRGVKGGASWKSGYCLKVQYLDPF